MQKTSKLVLTAAAILGGTMLATTTDIAYVNPETTVVAAKKSQHFSKLNYALMGYLKWSHQSLSEIDDESVTMTQSQKSVFTTTSADGQTITIKVGSSKVTVKDEDGNKKTYQKSQLKKKFKGLAAELTAKIAQNESGSDQKTGSSRTQSQSQDDQEAQSSSSGSAEDGSTHLDAQTQSIMQEFHQQETRANTPQ